MENCVSINCIIVLFYLNAFSSIPANKITFACNSSTNSIAIAINVNTIIIGYSSLLVFICANDISLYRVRAILNVDSIITIARNEIIKHLGLIARFLDIDAVIAIAFIQFASRICANVIPLDDSAADAGIPAPTNTDTGLLVTGNDIACAVGCTANGVIVGGIADIYPIINISSVIAVDINANIVTLDGIIARPGVLQCNATVAIARDNVAGSIHCPADGVRLSATVNNHAVFFILSCRCTVSSSADVVTLHHIVVSPGTGNRQPAGIIAGNHIPRAITRPADGVRLRAVDNPDPVEGVSQVGSSVDIGADIIAQDLVPGGAAPADKNAAVVVAR